MSVSEGLCLWYLAGTRFSDGDGSSNEVQRTMLELINQLDGFDPRGNIKVLMATNRCNIRIIMYTLAFWPAWRLG